MPKGVYVRTAAQRQVLKNRFSECASKGGKIGGPIGMKKLLADHRLSEWRSKGGKIGGKIGIKSAGKHAYGLTSPLEIAVATKFLDVVGIPYERQKQFGRYKADFYLPELNIVLEADSSLHEWSKVKAKDLKRDESLASMGITTVRLTEKDLKQMEIIK